jgi:hypothetical protein
MRPSSAQFVMIVIMMMATIRTFNDCKIVITI